MPNYVTAEEVKSFAKLTYEDLGYADEEQYDAFLNDLITAAESVVDQYCNVPAGFFKAGGVTFTDQVYNFTYPRVYLRYKPVITVSTVKINTQGFGQTPSWKTLTEYEDYIVDTQTSSIYFCGDLPAIDVQSVKISYTAGYSSTPEVVQFVIKSLCSNMLHEILQRKISPMVRIDDWTVRLLIPDCFTRELKAMLEPYVRRFVGAG